MKFSQKPIEFMRPVNKIGQLRPKKLNTIQFLKIDTKLDQVKAILGIYHPKRPNTIECLFFIELMKFSFSLNPVILFVRFVLFWMLEPTYNWPIYGFVNES